MFITEILNAEISEQIIQIEINHSTLFTNINEFINNTLNTSENQITIIEYRYYSKYN